MKDIKLTAKIFITSGWAITILTMYLVFSLSSVPAMALHMAFPLFGPILLANTAVHGGKEAQGFFMESLFGEHTGGRILQCVMGCKASYIPILSLFSPLSSTDVNSLFPSFTSLPAATSSYSA